jgi:hypothetical protein
MPSASASMAKCRNMPVIVHDGSTLLGGRGETGSARTIQLSVRIELGLEVEPTRDILSA